MKRELTLISDHVMDANALAQDASDNVISLHEGVSIRREIDQAEDAIRLRIRSLTRELAMEHDPVRRTMIYNMIERLWALEDKVEYREDVQDMHEAGWIGALKSAAEKIIALMQKAAGGLEAILAALRRSKRKVAI